jgi:hypothetical protein
MATIDNPTHRMRQQADNMLTARYDNDPCHGGVPLAAVSGFGAGLTRSPYRLGRRPSPKCDRHTGRLIVARLTLALGRWDRAGEGKRAQSSAPRTLSNRRTLRPLPDRSRRRIEMKSDSNLATKRERTFRGACRVGRGALSHRSPIDSSSPLCVEKVGGREKTRPAHPVKGRLSSVGPNTTPLALREAATRIDGEGVTHG